MLKIDFPLSIFDPILLRIYFTTFFYASTFSALTNFK